MSRPATSIICNVIIVFLFLWTFAVIVHLCWPLELSVNVAAESLDHVLGEKADGRDIKRSLHSEGGVIPMKWPLRCLIVAVFVTIQMFFLRGVGVLFISASPKHKKWSAKQVRNQKLIVAGVYALIFSGITIGLLMAGLDVTSTLDPLDSKFGGGPRPWVYKVLLGFWLLWLIPIVPYILFRDSRETMPRLAATLLAGSWVEFTTALPVYIAERPNTSSPWLLGSWVSLLAGIPVLTFSVGPGLLLLYFHHRVLNGQDPTLCWEIIRKKIRILR